MFLEPQPEGLRRSRGLTLQQVEDMVIHSAKFTHLWANRRYQGWIFDVDLDTMTVYRMGYYNDRPTKNVRNRLTN